MLPSKMTYLVGGFHWLNSKASAISVRSYSIVRFERHLRTYYAYRSMREDGTLVFRVLWFTPRQWSYAIPPQVLGTSALADNLH